jgi:hypothetical protein
LVVKSIQIVGWLRIAKQPSRLFDCMGRPLL